MWPRLSLCHEEFWGLKTGTLTLLGAAGWGGGVGVGEGEITAPGEAVGAAEDRDDPWLHAERKRHRARQITTGRELMVQTFNAIGASMLSLAVKGDLSFKAS